MTQTKSNDSISELIEIMVKLRAIDGCEWDRAQTPESLKHHIIEEAYELIDAISSGNPLDICDELGDLLLQVVFQAQIFSETGHFTIHDVARNICDKLIRRHPHIFSTAPHVGHEQRWEVIKQQERLTQGKSNKLAARIPSQLPALQRATKIGRKTPRVPTSELKQKIQQQLDQLDIDNNTTVQSEQIGHLLFDMAQLAAECGIDAEVALRQTTTDLIAKIDSKAGLL